MFIGTIMALSHGQKATSQRAAQQEAFRQLLAVQEDHASGSHHPQEGNTTQQNNVHSDLDRTKRRRFSRRERGREKGLGKGLAKGGGGGGTGEGSVRRRTVGDASDTSPTHTAAAAAAATVASVPLSRKPKQKPRQAQRDSTTSGTPQPVGKQNRIPPTQSHNNKHRTKNPVPNLTQQPQQPKRSRGSGRGRGRGGEPRVVHDDGPHHTQIEVESLMPSRILDVNGIPYLDGPRHTQIKTESPAPSPPPDVYQLPDHYDPRYNQSENEVLAPSPPPDVIDLPYLNGPHHAQSETELILAPSTPPDVNLPYLHGPRYTQSEENLSLVASSSRDVRRLPYLYGYTKSETDLGLVLSLSSNVNHLRYLYGPRCTQSETDSSESLSLATPPPPLESSSATVNIVGAISPVYIPTPSAALEHNATPKAQIEYKDHRYALILQAAQAAVSTLDKLGLKCALFGSLASKLYGASRVPKDVDLLTFPSPTNPLTPAQIKDMIVANDSRFFLKLPKDPRNTYRILWFRRPNERNAGGIVGVDRKIECKVDILIPGIMSLPDLGERAEGVRWIFALSPVPLPFGSRTFYMKGETSEDLSTTDTTIVTLPALPFPIILLQKLQGWSDHRVASEPFKMAKQVQDAVDVKSLLGLQLEMNHLISSVSPSLQNVWTNSTWFPEEFQEVNRKRVRLYCHYFPGKSGEWAKLGFEVEPREGEVEEEVECVRRAIQRFSSTETSGGEEGEGEGGEEEGVVFEDELGEVVDDEAM
ncbi:hypothetical protein BDQ17DRAFT_1364114 [Cyathus striatus]|nr:hypothetical protein BDQ17DRAFT_1364114 [Cyathus striatus]